MNGVVVINKESGYTSFDVIAVVRKLLGTKKCGHCGTLDPNATGVLPVLIGNATKAQDIIPNHDKAYIAKFMFGTHTDTLDIWGKVIRQEQSFVTKDELSAVVCGFVGDIQQIPPMYSAVQKDGVRLYDLARKGIEVEREARTITIYELKIDSFDEATQSGTLYVSCSKGTYIRQLIADIAKALSSCAVMTALQRVSACGFDLSQAVTIAQLRECVESGSVDTLVQSTESLFYSYPELVVSDKQAHRFTNGNPLDLQRTTLRDKEISDGTVLRIKDQNGIFCSLGIVNLQKQEIKMYKHF